MFSKLLLAAVVAPLVASLTLNAPVNVTSGQPVNITWEWVSGRDPDTFSLFLVHPSLINSIAIANNVEPGPQTITLTIPIVAATSGYSLSATHVSNITDVYASSPTFSIGGTSTLSSTSTGSSTSVSLRSTTSPTQSTLIVRPSSTTTSLNAGLGSATDTSSLAPTASPSSGSRQFDFKISSIVVAGLAIAGAFIFAL